MGMGIFWSTVAAPIASERLGSIRRSMKRRNQIGELYDSLRPSLFAYLSCIGLSSHESEDVVHETFLRLVKHLLKGGDESNLRGWVFRVAHNAAMDLSRSSRTVPAGLATAEELPVAEPRDIALNPEEAAIRQEDLRNLRAAMARLTEQQRYAVLLRAEGLRYREIAGVLGVSPQRVADLVTRALTRLAGDV